MMVSIHTLSRNIKLVCTRSVTQNEKLTKTLKFVQIYFIFGGFTRYFDCLISDWYCFHTAEFIS